MVQWTSAVTTAGGAAKIVLLIILIFIVFSLLGWWIYRLTAYNKECVIKNVTGGGTPLREKDWAKQKKDKETGALYWRLKKRKLTIPRPPAKAIGMTRKGKEYAEFYDVGQNNLVPIDASISSFTEDKNFIEAYQPVTETQRSFIINQIKKSQLMKTKGLTELLMMATPYIALVMILAIFLLFLNDGMKPIIEQAKIAQEGTKTFLQAAQLLSDKCGNVQVIGSRPLGNFTPPN
jgi:hypothetical protein